MRKWNIAISIVEQHWIDCNIVESFFDLSIKFRGKRAPEERRLVKYCIASIDKLIQVNYTS